MVLKEQLVFKFLLLEGVEVLKELIYNSSHFVRVWWS